MRETRAALLCLALFACAAPEPPPPALVRVEVVRAEPLAPAWDPATPLPVHMLLDLTSSMEAQATQGVTYLQAARYAALRFLRSMPEDADITLHILGTAVSSACRAAVPVRVPEGSLPGPGLARIAASLPSRSEGSLAGSVEAIARLLEREQRGGTGARVLAISDLDDSCQERDLCQAAAALAAAGADLDLVVIGEAPVPACLEEIGDDQAPPLVEPTASRPLSFRVAREGENAEAPGALVGKVGAGALEVAPGRVRIGVDLDPPVAVGPIDLAPNASLRIRILEVPGSQPLRRQVFVEGADASGGEGSVP